MARSQKKKQTKSIGIISSLILRGKEMKFAESKRWQVRLLIAQSKTKTAKKNL